eukprot:1506406-Rhodomonas_salina.1
MGQQPHADPDVGQPGHADPDMGQKVGGGSVVAALSAGGSVESGEGRVRVEAEVTRAEVAVTQVQ